MAVICVEVSNKKFMELIGYNAEGMTKAQYNEAILMLAGCTEFTHTPVEQASLLAKLTKILNTTSAAETSTRKVDKKPGRVTYADILNNL